MMEIDLTERGPVKSYINIPKVLSESSSIRFWRWSGTIFQRNYFAKAEEGSPLPKLAEKYNLSFVLLALHSGNSGIASSLDWTVNTLNDMDC